MGVSFSETSVIQREGNRIFFGGRFIIDELLASLAALHQTVTAGFDTIVLDFNPCQLATAPPVLALCAKVSKPCNSEVGSTVQWTLLSLNTNKMGDRSWFSK